MVAIIGKISAKGVCGNVKKVLRENLSPDQETMDLMRVIGVASGVKTGTSDHGDWVALLGNFKATNLVTGEIFQSGKCFLPDIASDMIAPVVSSGQPVEFAIDIYVQIDDESATGYIYGIKPLVTPGADDAISRLEHAVTNMLEAPKDEKPAKEKPKK